MDINERNNNPLFSIVIPTWNNLDFLKLCIQSIQKNSFFSHQILIHINDGSDGTLEWVKDNALLYKHSSENIGICLALNGLRPLVETQYIVFINDDMYVCPDWDKYIFEEINSLPDNRFFISSTLLQPKKFWCKSVISPADFGTNPTNFRENELLANFALPEHDNWSGATWPLNIVHRDIWDIVGGYSIEFSPGMYSDPDFSAKLWNIGIRYFKGISKSRVYHFEAASTGRVKKNPGNAQFLNKWGITANVFTTYYLKRGEKFTGILTEPINNLQFRIAILRNKIKKIFILLSGKLNDKKLL